MAGLLPPGIKTVENAFRWARRKCNDIYFAENKRVYREWGERADRFENYIDRRKQNRRLYGDPQGDVIAELKTRIDELEAENEELRSALQEAAPHVEVASTYGEFIEMHRATELLERIDDLVPSEDE